MNQVDIDKIKKSNRLKLTWGLVCLIGPTALIVGALLIYATVNFITGTTEPQNSGDSDVARTITNVVLFLVGATSVATWLPGLIVGIILIATRKPVPKQ